MCHREEGSVWLDGALISIFNVADHHRQQQSGHYAVPFFTTMSMPCASHPFPRVFRGYCIQNMNFHMLTGSKRKGKRCTSRGSRHLAANSNNSNNNNNNGLHRGWRMAFSWHKINQKPRKPGGNGANHSVRSESASPGGMTGRE